MSKICHKKVCNIFISEPETTCKKMNNSLYLKELEAYESGGVALAGGNLSAVLSEDEFFDQIVRIRV